MKKTDPLNWTVQERKTRKKKNSTKKYDDWQNVSHHARMSQALKSVSLRIADENTNNTTVVEYMLNLERISDNLVQQVERICAA